MEQGGFYENDEAEEIHDVMQKKKQEHRVEIRRKKMNQELQMKRLKISNSSYQYQPRNQQQNRDNNMFNSIANVNIFGQSLQHNNEQSSLVGQSQQFNQQHNINVTPSPQDYQQKQNNNNIEDFAESELSQQNLLNGEVPFDEMPPSLLEFSEHVNKLASELQETYKAKNILASADLIQTLKNWISYYVLKKELFEAQQILRLCVLANIHSFCTAFTSMKYLAYDDLQLNSYYILAQITCILERSDLNVLVEKHLFNHFIQSLQHQTSPQILDNLFHTMSNLAGDQTYGGFFCYEMVEQGMIMGIAEVIEKQSEESIEVFLQSLLFFLHNLFCNIPESQRNEVFQFFNLMTVFIKCFPSDEVKMLCTKNLKLLLTYEPKLAEKFTEDDFSILVSLLESGNSQYQGIILLNTIVFESSDEIVQRLVQSDVVAYLARIIEKGKLECRVRAALVLSNLASVNDQVIQDALLKDHTYEIFMKALMTDSANVRRELAFFLINLTKSGTSSTKLILAKKKSLITFLKMIFEHFSTNNEIIYDAINAFWSFFESISLFAVSKDFQMLTKQIEETGLFICIEMLRDHPNKSISKLAEETIADLKLEEIIDQKRFQPSKYIDNSEKQYSSSSLEDNRDCVEAKTNQQMISE